MTDGATRTDRLALADWRRSIGTLYAEVRDLAVTDAEAAHAHWRRTRERLYREHPQSPVPAEARETFRGRYWPYEPALRFELPVEPSPPAPAAVGLQLPNSGADQLAFERVGRLSVPFAEGVRTLSLFWMAGYAGGLFLPFTDSTSGAETYAAGRYVLDAAKSADLGGDPTAGTLMVDFNFAYQPSCAFDPRWACPLAPAENRLDVPVRAGERIA